MAIFEREKTISTRDINKNNVLSNRGILGLLEDVACMHSEQAGYGINQMDLTHLSWVVLHWKVNVFKRPAYNETVVIRTWAKYLNKFTTYRDFEMLDKNGNMICVASSKWALVDTESGSLAKIDEKILNSYSPENDKNAFEDSNIDRIKIPEELSKDDISPAYSFVVPRRDIDVNKHMNNIHYLDFAIEALPEDIYQNINCNYFEIMYKNGAKLGNKVNCFYLKDNNNHFVIMKSANEENKLHAIIKLKNN